MEKLAWTTQERVLEETERLHASGVDYSQLMVVWRWTRDCRVAAQRPRRTTSAREFATEPWPYRACVALSQTTAAPELRDLVAPAGLTVRTILDDVDDDREDRRDRDLLANDSSFAMPFADELLQALPGCESTTCPLPDTAISFQLTYDTRGRLSELERIETIGGCR